MKLCFVFLCFFAAMHSGAWAKPKPKKNTPDAAATKADREKAMAIYKEAEINYKLQKYEEALNGFEESYRLAKEPALLFNIAQCYKNLGKLEDAKKAYQTFLRDASTSVLIANAQERIAEIDAEIKRLASKGSIKISSVQDPTEIFLDGVSKGSSPITLAEVDPGEHLVIIKKQGFIDSEFKATIKPGETFELNVPKLVKLLPTKPLFLSGAGLAGASTVAGGGWVAFAILADKKQRDLKAANRESDAATLDQISRGASFVSAGLAGAAVLSGTLWITFKVMNKKSAVSKPNIETTTPASNPGGVQP